MLEPSQIGVEDIVPLKCEECKLDYDNEHDLESIEEYGLCVDCGKSNFK